MKRSPGEKLAYNVMSAVLQFFAGGWMAMFFVAYVHAHLGVLRPVGFWTACVLAALWRAAFNEPQRKEEWL